MKRITTILFCISIAYIAFAQDNINLLDLIKNDNETADSTQIRRSKSGLSDKTYDWSERKHSISISYATRSLFDDIMTDQWNYSWKLKAPEYYTGSINMQYGYNAKRWLRVGGRYSYGAYREPGKVFHIHNFAAKLDFTYLNKEHVQLYSGLETGFGMLHYRQSDGKYTAIRQFWIFNLCPIGVQVGGKHAYFMAEVGLGNTELLRIGAGMHF